MNGFEAIAASAVPLTGGYGGETYAVSAAGEDAVLRLYVRQPDRAAVDVSLMELVRGLLPVPRVLDAKPEGSPDDPPYVLTERLPGVNLEVYLQTAGEAERRRVGEHLGQLLVRLSGMPFRVVGEFVGRELMVRPYNFGDLQQYVDAHVADLELDEKQVANLGEVIALAEDLLAGGVDRVCLVHSDFNPKNLLVDPDTQEITGLIDWEFAHAGSPYTDLGNLLRFCTDPAVGGAALNVVREGAPGLGDPRLQDLGRAADLWALIDLASRRTANPVAAAAHALITRIADTSDLAGDRPDVDVVPPA